MMFFCKKNKDKNKNENSKKGNEKEKEINNPSQTQTIINLPPPIYTCVNCSLIPEITDINYPDNRISIKCPFHKTNELLINDYLNNKINQLCNFCNKYTSNNNSIYYCYQCKKKICPECKETHAKEHNLINISEYNIKCQIHYDKKYLYYCYNCSSNLCEECNLKHDNEHNIILLSNNLLKIEEIDYITNKNAEYEKIIQNYKNYIYLNNLILDTYKTFSNNFYHIKNLKNIIRFLQNTDINNNIITSMQKDLEKQKAILEKFNEEYETELKIDTKVVYLNWKNITKEALENLCKIEFNEIKEFQSVGTNIENILFLKNSKFPKLQELYLTDNYIIDISVLEYVEFEHLKIIYLNKNKIKDISVFGRVKFIELNKLFLDSNCIDDISVLEKSPLVNLENVNLNDNFINDIKVLNKNNLVRLRFINIKRNKIDYTLKDNINIINDLRDKSIRIIY